MEVSMNGGKCKILILDWERDALMNLQHILKDSGVEPTITWDDIIARKLLRNARFDVILAGKDAGYARTPIRSTPGKSKPASSLHKPVSRKVA
jgi:predicted nicotinamide N-methyase